MKVNEEELQLLLEEQRPNLELKKNGFAPRKIWRRKKIIDPEFLFGHLSRLLESGIPILRAFHVLLQSVRREDEKQFLKDVRTKIEQGWELSACLADQTRFVNPAAIQCIRAGERSGKLPEILGYLEDLYRQEKEIRKKIQIACAYPCFVLLVGMLAAAGLFLGVVPKITSLYADFDTELPLITRGIIALSRSMPAVLGGLLVSGLLIAAALRKQRGTLANLLGHIKGLNLLTRCIVRCRFSNLLSLLLKSGVPLLEALQLLRQQDEHRSDPFSIVFLSEKISQGRMLSEGLSQLAWMSAEAAALIETGEETGKMPEMLARVAADARKKSMDHIEWMIKLVEPVLILLVGAGVALVVIGVLLPLLDMQQLLQ